MRLGVSAAIGGPKGGGLPDVHAEGFGTTPTRLAVATEPGERLQALKTTKL